MNLKTLIGAGHHITLATALCAVLCLVLKWSSPGVFVLDPGRAGIVLGWTFLAIGVPVWLVSAIQVLINVPKGRLITTGPFRLMKHPLYTAVGLLVIPGIGLLFGSWMWLVIGVVLYLSSRVFSGQEERKLGELFPEEYRLYRERVLLPWL